MESTSSSKKIFYDVFINHRGPDVKLKIASPIYQMLDQVGVLSFFDKHELKMGDFLTEKIKGAVQSASVHIAIFSPRYAESSWCLDELLWMLETKVPIIPVFYNVQPSELRHFDKGKGESEYARAFARHEGRYDSAKINRWKEALGRAANISGAIESDDNCDLGMLLKKIVTAVEHNMRKVPLGFPTATFGLDEAVEDFLSRVGSFTWRENVHIVGIVGMGGAGKTTLAKELYNRKRSSFNRSSFLDFSRNTLYNLQQNLLKDVRIKHSEFHDIHQGMGVLARCLKSMTVLIVLDNVDCVSQMEALLPQGMMENLGRGSLIIITTREVGVLRPWGISIYDMKLLDTNKAKQLFCRNAFFKPYSQSLDEYPNFEDLIDRYVKACNGLPLSLKVLGGMVNGKSKIFWESQLSKISIIVPEAIAKSLKVSYDALDPQVQQMFLDVACFFIGSQKNLVVAVWDGSVWHGGWSGEVGWQTLVDKCLVGLDNEGNIDMHDHLRDLGRNIAGDVRPYRIWKEEQILEETTPPIRGIVVESSQQQFKDPDYQPALKRCMETIIKSPSLRALQLLSVRENDLREEFAALSRNLVWLRWYNFNGTNLQPWLLLKNLRVLELYNAKNLEELWQDDVQLPLQLRELIIVLDRIGTNKFRLPRNIGDLKELKRIVLSGMPLTALPDSFKQLRLLEYLDISNSQSFCFTSEMLDVLEFMEDLRILKISYCPQLVQLPHLTTQGSLRELHLRYTGLWELPNNIGQLTQLETLVIGSDHLTSLPESLGELSCLTSLAIFDCHLLKYLPEALRGLPNLQSLEISETPVEELGFGMGPPSVCNLKSLKRLSLFSTLVGKITIFDHCCPGLETLWLSSNSHLTEIRDLPKNIKEITVHGCEKMWNMMAIFYQLNLENLVITDCPKLKLLPIPKYIFSDGRRIRIRGCPKADIDIFDDDGLIETVTSDDQRFIC